MANKKKYYVVWIGKTPGVYETWPLCEAQVKGYVGARFKSFPTQVAAWAAYKEGPTQSPAQQPQMDWRRVAEIDPNGIAVDAACARNPGPLEYRGVSLSTGQILFEQKAMKKGTNNLGEFIAIVSALALCQKNKWTVPIYTDSETALAWLKNKKVKSELPRDHDSEEVWGQVDKALEWLAQHNYPNPVLKWQTEKWGEIPADFGRK